MKFFGVKPFNIKNVNSIILGKDSGEERARLSSDTKRRVYERAQKRCESCGRPLRISEGEFHHIRRPNVKSRSSSIQFLCATCHRNYGHEWKTRNVSLGFGSTEKVISIKRKKVRKHTSSPYWKIRKRSKRRRIKGKTRKV